MDLWAIFEPTRQLQKVGVTSGPNGPIPANLVSKDADEDLKEKSPVKRRKSRSAAVEKKLRISCRGCVKMNFVTVKIGLQVFVLIHVILLFLQMPASLVEMESGEVDLESLQAFHHAGNAQKKTGKIHKT